MPEKIDTPYTVELKGESFELPPFTEIPYDALDALLGLMDPESGEVDQVNKTVAMTKAIKVIKDCVPEFAAITRVANAKKIGEVIAGWMTASQEAQGADLGK